MAANLFLASFINCYTSQDSAYDIMLTKYLEDTYQSSKKKITPYTCYTYKCTFYI